jgi:hypothetical protein
VRVNVQLIDAETISSARARIAGGIVTPMVFAVSRLITKRVDKEAIPEG